MKPCTLFLALLVFIPTPSAAQKGIPPATRPPVGTPEGVTPPPRPRAPIWGQVFVGETAPNFELDGSQGSPVKLSKLRGSWIVLAFADRRQQVANLRENVNELHQLGAQVVAVCHEKTQTLVNFAQRDSVPFLMLADFTGEVSATYGLFDHEQSETRPGYLVLDRKGSVRMAVLGQLLPSADVARLARIAITGL